MIDRRFKKINYNRPLNTSDEVKVLLKDLIILIRYYKHKTKFDGLKHGYNTVNSFIRFNMKRYLNDLKNDFDLWWSIYKFKKYVMEIKDKK